RQPGSQQLPGRLVPSSHCSPGSTIPLPQVGGDRQPITSPLDTTMHDRVPAAAQANVPVKVNPSGATVPESPHWAPAHSGGFVQEMRGTHGRGSETVNVPVAGSIVPVRGPGSPADGGVCVSAVPTCVNSRTEPSPRTHRPVILIVACADPAMAKSTNTHRPK